MSNEPNPFDPDGRAPWLRIYFGGVLCRCALTKIDGVSTKDEWKAQQSKETSGKVQVFSGTTKGKPKLTFLAHDRASYAWLREHWEMLKPVPTLGGGSAGPVAPTGGTAYAAAAQPKPGAVGSPPAPSKADAVDTAADTKASTSKGATSNPGPRPPTISVDYPSLQRHGITAVARGKWEDKGFTDTNGYEVEIEYVAQDPPKPAGGGAMPAATATPGGGFSGAAQKKSDAGSASSPAAGQAAGT